jgi:hypothetical protein
VPAQYRLQYGDRTMAYRKITVLPLAGALGAEVHDVDLTQAAE